MAARKRFSTADVIIGSLSVASVLVVLVIIAATPPPPHHNRVIKPEAHAQEPNRFPSGAAEKCVGLWFHPPPDPPEEEVVALCDALLLRIFDYMKGRNDLFPAVLKLENDTEAREKMEAAKVFHTPVTMADWSSE